MAPGNPGPGRSKAVIQARVPGLVDTVGLRHAVSPVDAGFQRDVVFRNRADNIGNCIDQFTPQAFLSVNRRLILTPDLECPPGSGQVGVSIGV